MYKTKLNGENPFFADLVMQKIKQKHLAEALEEFQQQLRNLDLQLLLNKPKHLVVKEIVSKMVWLHNTGLIKITRRRYFNKITGKYVYLLDEKLGLDKYKLVSSQYQELVFEYFEVFRSYLAIAKYAFNGCVSKSSIHNFFKNCKPKFTMKNYYCNNGGILWINADSLWNKKNKSKKSIEVKNLVFFTGSKLNDSKKKRKLEGKTLKHFIDANFEKIAKEVQAIIDQYSGVREVRMVGDRANWIRKLAKRVGAIYYIDKFHYKKYINDLMGKYFLEKDQIYQLIFAELSHNELREKLYQFVGHYQDGVINKKQQKIIGYLVNNVDYYIRNAKYDNPINCIENQQAHFQAKFLKNQRKGWCKEVLNNLITYIFSKQNGGNSIKSKEHFEDYYPDSHGYGIRASIPGSEDPKFAATIYKKY